MRSLIFSCLLFSFLFSSLAVPRAKAAPAKIVGCGALEVVGAAPGSNCPLTRTAITATVSGYVADVIVKQRFKNPFAKPIEAVYTFPMNEFAAVYAMTIRNGNRVIEGVIKTREEAQQAYDAARKAGHTAGLLEQERPNVFRQSLANIEPGKPVDVEIHYTQYLSYSKGAYQLTIPTTVGTRCDATAEVATAVVPAMRSGHDVTIDVHIDSPTTIGAIESGQHSIFMHRKDTQHADIALLNGNEIPNRDFVLTWKVASDSIKTGSIAHKVGKDGYLSLVFMPPLTVAPADAAPKEVIFVIDRSGSQEGLGIDSCKATVHHLIHHLNPNDTFNVASFSDHTEWFFAEPKPVAQAALDTADKALQRLDANGSTDIAGAVQSICAKPAAENRLRIVVFMSDGFVGDDFKILSLVKLLRGNSRWFAFGTGSSANRFLLDNMAREGGGESTYVLESSDTKKVAEDFLQKLANPVMTDVQVDFASDQARIDEVFPRAKMDVWLQRPLYFTAHYTGSGTAVATIRGFSGGKPVRRQYAVPLPAVATDHACISRVWARNNVDDLMSQDWAGAHRGQFNEDLKKRVVALGLQHKLMTQFTSFVAVDASHTVKKPGMLRVEVANEEPAGSQSRGLLVGAPVDPRFGQSNEIGQLADYGCVTYRGMHQWFNDDFFGNLCTQIGQLIGKWISELINGWMADGAEIIATTFLCVILLPAHAAPQFALAAIGLLAANIGIIALTARRREHCHSQTKTDMLSLPLLICLAVPCAMALCAPYVVRWAEQLNCMMMPVALASSMKSMIFAGIGGLTSTFAPLFGSVTLGFFGSTVGQILVFSTLMIGAVLTVVIDLMLASLAAILALSLVTIVLQILSSPLAIVLLSRPRTAPFANIFFALFTRCASVAVCATLALFASSVVLLSEWNPWHKLFAAATFLTADMYLCTRLLKLFLLQQFLRRKQIRQLPRGGVRPS